MNFIEKTFININRLVDPEFNSFWKESQKAKASNDFEDSGNFNKAGNVNQTFDTSSSTPLDLGDYGIIDKRLKNKNVRYFK